MFLGLIFEFKTEKETLFIRKIGYLKKKINICLKIRII